MDGSGKTTQAKRLVKALETKGIKCKYVWNTYQPLIAKPFLLLGKVFFFRGKDAFKDYTRYSGNKAELFSNSFVSWVYEYLSLFDYLCQSLVTIKLPYLLNSNIICDRYAQDVVVNMAVDLGYSDKKLRSRLGKLLGWLPRPNLTFLMDVPEEIGFQRKDDTPSIEHLKRLRRIYLSIEKEQTTVMLDGTEDLAKLESIILSEVSRVVTLGGMSPSRTPENPTLELLKIIGTPLVKKMQESASGARESQELYRLAVRNKIAGLYLNALNYNKQLNKLKHEYQKLQARYLVFLEAIERIAHTLDASHVEYVVFKTLKPYPAIPSDIDVLILDNKYKEVIKILLKAGYSPLLSDIVDPDSLLDEESYMHAAEILSKPTYDKNHISPTGSTFIDNAHNIHIDLQKDLAVSYVIYMDKNKFTQYIKSKELPSGTSVKTLAPELDLATVMAHSLVEKTYSLSEFYTFSYYLSSMDEKKVSNFITIVKENRLNAALRAIATITAELHRATYGTVPGSLESVLTKTGLAASEAQNLRENGFRMPHKYRAVTLIKFVSEKWGESRFRRSVLTQAIKMLDPRLAKQVIGEVMRMRQGVQP
jgi:dTMP kinase